MTNLKITNDFMVYENSITAHISSGTTGFYQKHCHSISQCIDYAYKTEEYLGLERSDKLLIALSINHAFAFSYQLLPALVIGLDISFIGEFNPDIMAKKIVAENITAIALLPTMYHFLIKENLSAHKLKYLAVAGDIITESLYF